jgi:hypothetical protein
VAFLRWKFALGQVAFFLPVYVASKGSSPKTVRAFYFYLRLRKVGSDHGLVSVQRGKEGAYVPLDRNNLPRRRWNE